jgi:DHA3 family tetracycline resistance protein-like MFS transporter
LDPKTRATVLSISGQVDAIGQVGSGPIAAVLSLISLPIAIAFAGILLLPALPLIKKVENLSKDQF